VLVDITKDAQQATTIPVWSEEPVRLPGYRPDHTASVDDLDRAAEMIAQAKRPIILAGHGILRAEASQLLLEFVEKTGVLSRPPCSASAASPPRTPSVWA